MLLRIRPLVAVVGAALVVGLAPVEAAFACTKFASPSGADGASGKRAHPFRTAQKLANSLRSGQVGCLRTGTYKGNVKVGASGAVGAPIVITSYPGERAVVAGKLWIVERANFITVAGLNLDGRNAAKLPSPVIDGDDVTFVNNDVTNYNTSICFNLGPTTYGRAKRTVIEGNRIHNCGRLPAANRDHGIYVEHSTGARIVDNIIYDNADRGVQLYPDAQSTYVARNVIDGNGQGVLISGGNEDFGPQVSSDNVIEHNVITNSRRGNNVHWHWTAGIVGERNVVRQNCIFGGAMAAQNQGLAPELGYSAYDNLLADPRFLDPSAKNFGLGPDSPCRNLAGYRTPVAAEPGIELDPPRSPLRAGRPTTLTGRVKGLVLPGNVVLRARQGRRWKRVGKVPVRADGALDARLRLRSRRVKASSVRAARRARSVLIRASARGFGESNAVRFRIRGRRGPASGRSSTTIWRVVMLPTS